eukprot:s1306_g8.t1
MQLPVSAAGFPFFKTRLLKTAVSACSREAKLLDSSRMVAAGLPVEPPSVTKGRPGFVDQQSARCSAVFQLGSTGTVRSELQPLQTWQVAMEVVAMTPQDKLFDAVSAINEVAKDLQRRLQTEARGRALVPRDSNIP